MKKIAKIINVLLSLKLNLCFILVQAAIIINATILTIIQFI
ncbi:MAG: hypothetical protein V1914_04645 [archaeon]